MTKQKIQVFNLYGGPSTGKSTIAAKIFFNLKMQNKKVELVTEYAKDLVYEKRHNVLQKDQVYIASKQFRKLYRLINEVDIIITDSPLMLGCIYFKKFKDTQPISYETFHKLITEMNSNFDNINFLLKRNANIEYDTTGRYQSLEESKLIDNEIYDFLKNGDIPFTEIEIDNGIIKEYSL